jgi:hypothetical protein
MRRRTAACPTVWFARRFWRGARPRARSVSPGRNTMPAFMIWPGRSRRRTTRGHEDAAAPRAWSAWRRARRLGCASRRVPGISVRHRSNARIWVGWASARRSTALGRKHFPSLQRREGNVALAGDPARQGMSAFREGKPGRFRWPVISALAEASRRLPPERRDSGGGFCRGRWLPRRRGQIPSGGSRHSLGGKVLTSPLPPV